MLPWRTMQCLLTAAAIVALGRPASAGEKLIGNWLVTTEADRFAEGHDRVIAMTMQDGNVFAVRCLQKIFTLAISSPGAEIKEGDIFKIKFRADKNPIIETIGDAINERVIEIVPTPEMRSQLLTAREYAMRITTPAGTTFDAVIEAGQAARALPQVFIACPPPTD